MNELNIKSSFWCLPLEVVLRASSSIVLPPYPGSTIRGSLGMALLKISCVLRHQRCSECPLAQRCIYTYIFETPLYGDIENRKRFPNAPHPFVLDITFSESKNDLIIEKGEQFSFGLTLIGKGIEYLPHFIEAFSAMGEKGIGRGRGKFELEKVLSNGREIYADSTLYWPEDYLTLEKALEEAEDLSADRLRLRFITPLRLVFRKELVKIPEFHVIIGNLLQRIENLQRFHCENANRPFRKELIEKARSINLLTNSTEWSDWERYSHRKQRRMKLGGLVGEATYEGDLSSFLTLIILGEWIHIGKGTSFGLGKIQRLPVVSCQTNPTPWMI